MGGGGGGFSVKWGKGFLGGIVWVGMCLKFVGVNNVGGNVLFVFKMIDVMFVVM